MPLNEFKTAWGFDGGVDIHMDQTYVTIPHELIPILIHELRLGYAKFEGEKNATVQS